MVMRVGAPYPYPQGKVFENFMKLVGIVILGYSGIDIDGCQSINIPIAQ